jgi:hypothetical protein
MKPIKETHAVLPTDKDGAVANVRCDKNHGGNHRFYQSGHYCECSASPDWTDTERTGPIIEAILKELGV